MNNLPTTHTMSEVIEYLEKQPYSIFTRNSDITIEYEEKSRKLKFTVHKVSGKNRIEYSGKINPKMKFQEFLNKFEQICHKNSAIWSAVKKLLEQIAIADETSSDTDTNDTTLITTNDEQSTSNNDTTTPVEPTENTVETPKAELAPNDADSTEAEAELAPNDADSTEAETENKENVAQSTQALDDMTDDRLFGENSGNNVIDAKFNRINQTLVRLKRKFQRLDDFVKQNQGLTNINETVKKPTEGVTAIAESSTDTEGSTNTEGSTGTEAPKEILRSKFVLSPVEVSAEFGNFSLGYYMLQLNITSSNLQFRLMRFGIYELSTSGALPHNYGYADTRRALSDLFSGRLDNSLQQLIDHNEAKFSRAYPVSTKFSS